MILPAHETNSGIEWSGFYGCVGEVLECYNQTV